MGLRGPSLRLSRASLGTGRNSAMVSLSDLLCVGVMKSVAYPTLREIISSRRWEKSEE